MQIAVPSSATRHRSTTQSVTHDLACLRTVIANVFLYGVPGQRDWVLIDTGIYGSAGSIARAAEERFGRGARPVCIVLTHGHFDHVGAVRELSRDWDVPVYAHTLELPYLTGRESYPPPDPSVGGGAMAALSWMYPRRPIDISERVHALPADGSVPGMPGWRWVHTPGHTVGHVSLFRDGDRCLVAGDAVITVQQESALAVLTQRPELHGPPAYFTPDWASAHQSVRVLADLEPEIVATGHGTPLRGPAVREQLHRLARDFERVAVPRQGRYVDHPEPTRAFDRADSPAGISPRTKAILALGTLAMVGTLLNRRGR